MSYSAMACEPDEIGFQFPFECEVELPVPCDVMFPFKHEQGLSVQVAGLDLPYYDSDESEYDEISNAFQQILDINEKMASTVDYEAELKKRGAPFKHGLVNLYIHKFPFEDQENVPITDFYTSIYKERARLPNALEIVKRFLKQVRESNGYDVDCEPPGLCTPFTIGETYPEDEYYRNAVMQTARIAIEKINAETGKSYELVQLEKILYADSFFRSLLTFTVKEAGTSDDTSLRTIRAMLNASSHSRDREYTLDEWMFKSPTSDISGVDMDQ